MLDFTIRYPQSEIDLPLALFMLGVFLVNDVEAAFASDDLVVLTPLLDTGTHFHRQLRLYDSTNHANEARYQLPKRVEPTCNALLSEKFASYFKQVARCP